MTDFFACSFRRLLFVLFLFAFLFFQFLYQLSTITGVYNYLGPWSAANLKD